MPENSAPYRFVRVLERGARYLAKYEVRLRDPHSTYLGSVERRETTETGFRGGYCVGQVECVRWFARTPDGKVLPDRWHSDGKHFTTRAAAADALRVIHEANIQKTDHA